MRVISSPSLEGEPFLPFDHVELMSFLIEENFFRKQVFFAIYSFPKSSG